jgi:spore germination protein GerM
MRPAIAALLLLATAYAPAAQKQRPVQVYLYNASAESEQNPLGLAPIERLAPTAAPARTALEALLAGPNRTEIREGFKALDSEGLKLRSLVNRSGTWHVKFASKNGKTWPGTLSPARFQQAVIRTMKQFPTVRRVVVYVDGRTDFASGR